MKNSTLSRKPSHDMKKNMGAQPVRTRADQSGDGADFAFNGQMGDGVNRSAKTDRYSKNQHTGHSNDGRDVNFGMGPRTGVAAGSAKTSHVIATAVGGQINGGAECKSPANPSKINMGLGPRKGNQ
jgi:hypothetical protein